MAADSLSHESSSPFTGGGSPRPFVDTGGCPTPREGTAFADTGGYPKRGTAAHYTRLGVCHTCSRFTTHENG